MGEIYSVLVTEAVMLGALLFFTSIMIGFLDDDDEVLDKKKTSTIVTTIVYCTKNSVFGRRVEYYAYLI